MYGLDNFKFAIMEAKEMEYYNFGEEIFKRHDPKKVIEYHIAHVSITWHYNHDEWEEEEVKKNSLSYEEV
jgi:hypothetical protein